MQSDVELRWNFRKFSSLNFETLFDDVFAEKCQKSKKDTAKKCRGSLRIVRNLKIKLVFLEIGKLYRLR